MCMFIDSEVLLANLLHYRNGDNGVSYGEIENYCNDLKNCLIEDPHGNIHCISFQISFQTLREKVLRYPACFKLLSGKYYKGEDFNLSRFDLRTQENVKQILANVAQHM